MGDKETKIPGFPDPEKDLQHYLDRYDNEQNTKNGLIKTSQDKQLEKQFVRFR